MGIAVAAFSQRKDGEQQGIMRRMDDLAQHGDFAAAASAVFGQGRRHFPPAGWTLDFHATETRAGRNTSPSHSQPAAISRVTLLPFRTASSVVMVAGSNAAPFVFTR